MIYFLQPVDGGPVKIGFTDDLDTRRKALESRYGQPLALLTTLDGGREREGELFARFAHLRFGRTEQFRPAPELFEFIGRPLLVSANPDAVEVMPSTAKPTVLAIKGNREWREWVDRGAKHCRTDVAKLVDTALIHYLKDQGFAEPAPER
jgi:hypothetical protein